MARERGSVPIPAVEAAPARNGRSASQPSRDGVMRSSLELVFSYSRSQQRFFGGLPSAPSFVVERSSWSSRRISGERTDSLSEGSWYHSRARPLDFESGLPAAATESIHDEDEERLLFDTVHPTSDSPTMFPTDPIGQHAESPLEAPRPLPAARPFLATTAGPALLNVLNSIGSHKLRHHDLTNGEAESPTKHPADPTSPMMSGDLSLPSRRGTTERTPLLSERQAHRITSPRSRAITTAPTLHRPSIEHITDPHQLNTPAASHVDPSSVGSSSDGQTLFNAVAVLLGVGLLSLPLAFAYTGWLAGTILLVAFAGLTCHTAKLLAGIMRPNTELAGYSDIGRLALGSIGGTCIDCLFCLELFALGVAFIILSGDTLHTLYPQTSSDIFKAAAFVCILPTTFLPLRFLAIPSLFSTLSSLLLILVIIADGLWKSEAPGSLRDPMPTNWLPETAGANWLGGVGLILAGFGGHAVIPSLAKDMRRPDHFDSVMNKAFGVATLVSLVAGASGYLMIGNDVSDEITRDLLLTKYGYPTALNVLALWMILVIPLTKFGLCSRPLNTTLEGLLGLRPRLTLAPSLVSQSVSISNAALSALSRVAQSDYLPAPQNSLHIDNDESPDQSFRAVRLEPSAREAGKGAARVLVRVAVTTLCTATAIALPGFGRIMAFLGSFSAFLICIILPLVFHLRLTADMPGGQRRLQKVALAASVAFMIAGTAWTFSPQ